MLHNLHASHLLEARVVQEQHHLGWRGITECRVSCAFDSLNRKVKMYAKRVTHGVEEAGHLYGGIKFIICIGVGCFGGSDARESTSEKLSSPYFRHRRISDGKDSLSAVKYLADYTLRPGRDWCCSLH